MKQKFSHVVSIFLLHSLMLCIAQSQNPNVLLKATVLDSLNRSPLSELPYRIYEIKANQLQFVSKGKTKNNGILEAVLASGKSYIIQFSDYRILRKSDTLIIPSATEFQEIHDTILIRKLTPGEILSKLQIFQEGTAEISPEGEQALENILQLLRKNRSLFLKLEVINNGNEQNPPLLNERLQTLQDWYRDRQSNISVRRFVLTVDPNQRDTVDAYLRVKEVRNLFE